MYETLNKQNPLTRYKLENPNLKWTDIGDKLGMWRITLSNIAKKDKEQILRTPVGTYLKIKEVLGIDMVNDWTEINN